MDGDCEGEGECEDWGRWWEDPELIRLHDMVEKRYNGNGGDNDDVSSPTKSLPTPAGVGWSRYEPEYGGWTYHDELLARLGLQCYNLQNGSNFMFSRMEEDDDWAGMYYYLTMEARDVDASRIVSFRTVATYFGLYWTTYATHFKSDGYYSHDDWDPPRLKMPKWLSDEELAQGLNTKYYLVQESGLRDNDYLQLLVEIAFCSIDSHPSYPPSLEIKRVVVETQEKDATREPHDDKLIKAENAIFYITYTCNDDGDASTGQDYKGIIRRTMDGKPGHMDLQVSDDITGEKEKNEEEAKKKKKWNKKSSVMKKLRKLLRKNEAKHKKMKSLKKRSKKSYASDFFEDI